MFFYVFYSHIHVFLQLCPKLVKIPGCHTTHGRGYPETTCFCLTDMCNDAMISSTVGLVVIVVSLLVSVIVGHMM